GVDLRPEATRQECDVRRGGRCLAEPMEPIIPNDADDLKRLPIEQHGAADDVHRRPEPPGHRLVDERDAWCRCVVMLGELATGEHRHMKECEVSGTDVE